MNKIYSYFLVLFSFSVFSQSKEITIILLDSKSNIPVSNATITVLRTNQGLVSNDEGVFVLNLDRPSLIEIYHTDYKKVNIKSSTLKEDVNEVFLDFSGTELNEIILGGEDSQKTLASLIKNSSKKLTVPCNLRVYTREFFKINDQYTYFNDGLMNFQILGDYKKITTDILVEQNRSIGFFDEKDFDILGYNLNNLMENYYQFKYLDEILGSNAKKKYDFSIEKHSKDGTINKMIVRPYTTSEGPLSVYTIIYDVKNKLIIEVSSYLPEDRIDKQKRILDYKNRKVFKSEFKTFYRIENKDYYLANSQEVIGFTAIKDDKEVKIEVKNNLITSEFRTQIFKYDEMETFKDKSLINKFDTILTDFWNLDSGIALTQAEKDILEKIQK